MSDLFSGFSGSLGSFVRSWLLPSVLAVGLWSFFIFELVEDRKPFSGIMRLDSTERLFVIAFVSLAIAYCIASISTPLYQVLEGYIGWPSRLKASRIADHKEMRKKLREATGARKDRLERQSNRVQLDRYPRRSSNVMPTRLGNILRSAETYGNVQYGIDVVVLWFPLTTVADEQQRTALDETRSVMDFFVGLILLAPLFAISSVVTAIMANRWSPLIGLLAILVTYPAYRGAVAASVRYGRVVRSLADVARHSLAEKLHLRIPASFQAERILWEAVSDLVAWGPLFSSSAGWESEVQSARSSYDKPAKTSTDSKPRSAEAEPTGPPWVTDLIARFDRLEAEVTSEDATPNASQRPASIREWWRMRPRRSP